MRTRTLLPLFSALLLLAVAQPARSQGSNITFESTELASGLYMIQGVGGFAGGNLGLLMGEDGVVLIDDGLPPLIDKVQAAIDKLTTDPVEFLINTHVHGDHVGGNEELGKEGATIVAHDNLRRRMASADDKPAPEALPVVTFSDSVTFHLNGRGAFVFHVANAHTDGDAVIHFREDNVIHAGDVMFNGLFPFIDLNSGGTVAGYIEAQKRILELCNDETRIIPGHGPLASKKDLTASIEMLEASVARISELVAAGRSKDEILLERPLADYGETWSWGFITTERMTETIYNSLTAD